MSPFAYQLRKIRTERKLQQKTMAELIGCEPSYLSALETDAKVPPQKEKLAQFLKKLKLSPTEELEILKTADRSRRSIRLPLKAQSEVFEVCHELEDRLPFLSQTQLKIIGLVLSINSSEMGVPKM